MRIKKKIILLLFFINIFLFRTSSAQVMNNLNLNDGITVYIEDIVRNFHSISDERKEKLKEIADYIRTKQINNDTVNLIFICTHNSRRSHFSQIWAQTAAYYYGFNNVYCYSGGTEATACNIRTVNALKRSGFSISTYDTLTVNPHYFVKFSTLAPIIEAFSKKFDSDSNPKQKFAAIMTCSQADETCPFVSGTDKRIAIPYKDPKIADKSPEEDLVYNERCKQIATEMFFVFASLK
jgi:protein-tyrosine-phosphatase